MLASVSLKANGMVRAHVLYLEADLNSIFLIVRWMHETVCLWYHVRAIQ